jgi:hypothetical protein
MLPNIAKLQPMLERMTGPQLQQFAAMHHDDAVAVGLAMQIDRDRKEEMARLQGLMSGQKQPTVVDQAIQALGGQQQQQPPPPPPQQGIGAPPQGMPPQGAPQGAPQLPEQQGIGQLPAPNMEQMADGGIAGYADGGTVHMDAGGVANAYAKEIADMRSQLARMGMPQKDVEAQVAEFIRLRTPGSTDTTSAAVTTSPLISTPITVRQIPSSQSAYNTSANPPMIPNARMTGAAPAVGPNDPGKAFTQRNIAEAAARVPELGDVIFNMQNSRYSPPPSLPLNPELNPTAPAPKGPAPKPAAAPGEGISLLKPSDGITALVNSKGISPEEAKKQAGVFMDQPEAERIMDAAKRQFTKSQADTTAAFNELPQLEKADETAGAKYAAKTRQELEKEKETFGPMFLINAGLAIASGKSPRFLENVAGGVSKGFEQHKEALKEFKTASRDLDKFEMLEKERRRAEEYGRAKDVFALKSQQAQALSDFESKVADSLVNRLNVKAQVASDIAGKAAQNASSERIAGITAETNLSIANNHTRVALAQLKKEPDVVAAARLFGGGDLQVGLERMHRKSDEELLIALNSSVVSQNKGIMDPTQHQPLFTMADIRNMRSQNRPPVMNMSPNQAAPLLMGGGIPSVIRPGPNVISNDPRFDTRGRVPTTTPAPGTNIYAPR